MVDAQTYSFAIGTFDGLAVADGQFNYPAQSFFFNVPPDELADGIEKYEVSAQQVTTPHTCLYLNTGTHQIPSDTGAGPVGAHAGEIFPDVDHTSTSTGHLLENLRAEGISPSEVDTVLLTHAHPDHVGGLVNADGDLAFGNAQHFIGDAEWQFWFSEAAEEKASQGMVEIARTNLSAVDGQVERITPTVEVRPGIRAISAPGHTPGHLAVSIRSEGEELLHRVDLVLHPLLMEHPDWEIAFDIDPGLARQTRRHVLDEVADKEIRALGYHIPPFPSIGHIVRGDEGWHWQPVQRSGPTTKRTCCGKLVVAEPYVTFRGQLVISMFHFD